MFVEDIRTILFRQKKFDFDDPSCFNDEGYQSIVGLSKGISRLKIVVEIV